jgi:hypothetical protein
VESDTECYERSDPRLAMYNMVGRACGVQKQSGCLPMASLGALGKWRMAVLAG